MPLSPQCDSIQIAMIRYSVLDLSPIVQGGTAAAAFRNTLDLARQRSGATIASGWLSIIISQASRAPRRRW